MRTLLSFCCFFFFSFSLFASHLEAGEITYKQIQGFTYEATLVFYVRKAAGVPGETTINEFHWGDGTAQKLNLTSETTLPDGLTLKRVYVATHTYKGSGIYNISIDEQVRDPGIKNISASQGVAFYIASELIVNPFQSNLNNSPILYNPPLDKACIFQIYEHNPVAVDPDGDSLSYQLVNCRGESGDPIIYVLPDQINPGPNNTISIDPYTGTVHWESPQDYGAYNIAILITEWRNGVKVGSVLRDMRINVETCTNLPPVVDLINDTCVLANTNLEIKLRARDAVNTSDQVTLTGIGAPFVYVSFPAIIDNNAPGNPTTAEFKWSVTCDEVRKAPYQAVIKAVDNGVRPIADYQTFNIRVIAPAVRQVGVTTQSGGNLVVWQASDCMNASCYQIWRADKSSPYTPGPCETGPVTGDTLIGTVDGRNTTNFIDTAVGFSGTYCYRIVTCFPDGSLSQVSQQVCTEVRLDLPMLYKASVGFTSTTKGIDTVAWFRPILIDTINSAKGPYQYKVFREDTIRKATKLIYSGPLVSEFYKADTLILDSNINTVDSIHTYRVEFYDNGFKVGSSPNGTTIFLKVQPGDRFNALQWNSVTPWQNVIYEVQVRNLLNPTQWDHVVYTDKTQFKHGQLINGIPRCYRVISSGRFENPNYNKPIINVSQEVCASPIDLSPPCQPTAFNLADFCAQEYNELTWDNALIDCNADLKEWTIYYSPTPNGKFTAIKSLPPSANSYIYTSEFGSIAGCFAIGGVDTSKNETVPNFDRLSPGSSSYQYNFICVDNCPGYKLPNVFTPNGDGINDLFVPFPHHGIQSVDAKIYNRWGKLLYETTDPDIKWDGKAAGKPVPDGVYFYVVEVSQIRLTGVTKETLKGTVTIFADKPEQPK